MKLAKSKGKFIMLQKVKIFLLISFFVFSSKLSSYQVDIKKIDLSLNIIQLGAFGNIENIEYISKLFSQKEIVVLNFSGLKKVFLPNISNHELKKTLYNVRKKIPDAFVLKNRSIFKSNNLKPNREVSYKPKYKSKQINRSLNSDTILKTRKTFF
jgi:hypothetical protein